MNIHGLFIDALAIMIIIKTSIIKIEGEMKNNFDMHSLENGSKRLEISFDVKITVPINSDHSTSDQRNISHHIDINDALNHEYVFELVRSNAMRLSSHSLANFDIVNIHIKEICNATEEIKTIKIMEDFGIKHIP